MKKSIYFVVTHPIQYFVPLYQEIAKEEGLDVSVFYCTDETIKGGIDKQFGIAIKWDIPLLDGYKHTFLKNNAWKPSLNNGFWGIANFGIIKALWQAPKGLVIINGWMTLTYILAFVFGKLFGHQVGLRGESPLIHEYNRTKIQLRIRNIVFKYLLFPFFDYFFFVGEQNKAFYSFYGVSEKKMFFAPYCVDNQRFQSEFGKYNKKQTELRTLLNLDKNKVLLMYSGKYISKKRPLDLLKAIKNIDNVQAIFVGEGELRIEMEFYILSSKLEKKTLLTGFINQNEISKYYSVADIYIMCSQEGETWGLSTNEAMNFGLPVIIYDTVGCAYDLVKNGENGFVIKKGDINGLTNAIEKLASDESLRKKAGEISLSIVQGYSYKKVIEGIKQAVNI